MGKRAVRQEDKIWIHYRLLEEISKFKQTYPGKTPTQNNLLNLEETVIKGFLG